jgi:uncharacterized iron-regulated membrane protein
MSRIRTVLFWLHLAAGVIAGVVVLIMSITGVALTYEKQVIEWVDRQAWSAPPSAPAERLSPETLLARVRLVQPEAVPTMVTVRADPRSPATVTFEGGSALLVDPYTGDVIGLPPTGLRTFFRSMTNWHRWLAMEGATRATGKAITGFANLLFLGIVLSGIYLWVPRIWTALQVKQVLWFRRGLSWKARDFNWHNVIGIWSAVPLAIVIIGAVPISYPWASNLVYRLAGEAPPTPQRGPGGPAGRGGAGGPGAGRQALVEPVDASGVDAGFAAATGRAVEWRAITVRVPRAAQSSVTFTVDEGYAGQPQKRGTLTFNRASGQEEKWESFSDASPGRRLRSWLRFAHTGEYYGLTGQTIAGLVSAGGVVLVWTGLALALRRLVAWVKRRRGRRNASPAAKAA